MQLDGSCLKVILLFLLAVGVEVPLSKISKLTPQRRLWPLCECVAHVNAIIIHTLSGHKGYTPALSL